jgi:hypothetical protein
MFQRKPRRFRPSPNGRGHRRHSNGDGQGRMRPHSFSNGPSRNSFRPTQSAEKLLEKYSTLAKEAMTSGDKTLSENYLQHADHYVRVIEDKNKNRIPTKVNSADNVDPNDKNLSEDSKVNQSNSEDSKVNQSNENK